MSSAVTPKLSTVHIGNAFEERSLNLLRQTMSMALTRVGGKEDGGVDLLGWWWLPHDDTSRTRLRVVAQCKAEQKKMGPAYVRELEGVLFRFMASDPAPVVALLISQSAFTKSAILRARSSPIPFLLLHLPVIEPPVADAQIEDGPGALGAALCNPALMKLPDVYGRMEIRWERRLEGLGGRPALWWKGQRLNSHIPEIEPSVTQELSMD
jgi:hypothetical protein